MALKVLTETGGAPEEKSVNTQNFTKQYFKNSILGNLKILIVITALNLLAFPVALASATFDAYQSYKNDYYYGWASELFMVLAVAFTVIAILAGVIIALNNFSYLYKKQNVDMYLSLPLKNSQRFLCDYFSGLAVYIIPFLLSGFVTYIISFFTTHFLQDMREAIGPTDFHGIIIRAYIGTAVLMIMFYTLTVLVSAICGSLFETIFYTAVLNGLIPGMIAITVLIFLGNSYGLIYTEYLTPLMTRTSPLGGLIGAILISEITDEEYYLSAGFAVQFCLWILAVTALYCIAAYLLYKHRKAEDVSKPFVYNVFYHVIITCIMLVMSSVVVFDGDFILPMVIAMAVVFLIFEVVNKRGFKKFGRSLIRCGATIAGCMAFSLLCSQTKGFGIANRVPSVSSVKSVTLTYAGPEIDIDIWDAVNLNDTNSITVSDPEVIEKIVEAHESILEKYKELGSSDLFFYGYDNIRAPRKTVQLKYTLKNGTSFSRIYEMTADELFLLDYVCQDSNYADEVVSVLEYHYYEDIIMTDIFGENRDVRSNMDFGEKKFEQFKKDIVTAYAKDIANRTYEQLVTPSEQPLAKIELGPYSGYVYSWDKNVIRVWDDGVEYFGSSGRDHRYLVSEFREALVNTDIREEYFVPYYIIFNAGYPSNKYDGYDYYADNYYYPYEQGEYKKVTKYAACNSAEYYAYSDSETYNGCYFKGADEKILKLQKEIKLAVVPYYKTEKPLYKVRLYDRIFLIPDEYTEDVDTIIEYYAKLNKVIDKYDINGGYYDDFGNYIVDDGYYDPYGDFHYYNEYEYDYE